MVILGATLPVIGAGSSTGAGSGAAFSWVSWRLMGWGGKGLVLDKVERYSVDLYLHC